MGRESLPEGFGYAASPLHRQRLLQVERALQTHVERALAAQTSLAAARREAAALAGDELYAQWLERARIDDLGDVAALNLLYVSGVDAEGRPIVVFCAAHMPTEQVDLDRVVRFVIRCLDALVSRGE